MTSQVKGREVKFYLKGGVMPTTSSNGKRNTSIILVAETAWDGVSLESLLQGFTLKVVFVACRVAIAVDSRHIYIRLAETCHRIVSLISDKRSSDRSSNLTSSEQFLRFVIVSQPLDLSALLVREHSVLHALLHGLGGLEHGEDWDLLASEGVGHKASEDGELVEHVQHEHAQANVNCVVNKF